MCQKRYRPYNKTELFKLKCWQVSKGLASYSVQEIALDFKLLLVNSMLRPHGCETVPNIHKHLVNIIFK